MTNSCSLILVSWDCRCLAIGPYPRLGAFSWYQPPHQCHHLRMFLFHQRCRPAKYDNLTHSTRFPSSLSVSPLYTVRSWPSPNRLRAVEIRLRRQIRPSALGARLHPPLFFGPLEYIKPGATLLALSGLSTLFIWAPSTSATPVSEKHGDFRPTRSRNSSSKPCLVSGAPGRVWSSSF